MFLFSLATRTGKYMLKVKLGDIPFSLALLFVPLSHLSSEDSSFAKLFLVLELSCSFLVSLIPWALCVVLLLATLDLQLLVRAPCSSRVEVQLICSRFRICFVVAVGAPGIFLRLSFFTCGSGCRSKA